MFGFHYPFYNSVSYNRIKLNNFKSTFNNLGINFYIINNFNDLFKLFQQNKIKYFYTSFSFPHKRFINFKKLNNLRKEGLKVFLEIPLWEDPLKEANFTDSKSLKYDKNFLELLSTDMLGDYYVSYVPANDPRMNNFQKDTGINFFTLRHGINQHSLFYDYNKNFKSDISFLGSNLSQKRKIFDEIFPLLKNYNFKIYGQGWSFKNRLKENIQKIGELFNINTLKKIPLSKIDFLNEKNIYSSSKININVHNTYELFYGGPINERFFSIAGCKSFQIVNHLKSIDEKFKEGDDIVTWKTKSEFIEKINYYLTNESERLRISKNLYKKVIKEHTYEKIISDLLNHAKIKI